MMSRAAGRAERFVHPVTRLLKNRADGLLAKADLALVRRSNIGRWRDDEKPEYVMTAAPVGAEHELRPDNPRLVDLRRRYRSHPAADASQWSDEFVAGEIDLRLFRADNAYVWQRRMNATPLHYALTTLYHQRYAPAGLMEALDEDGLFGAYTCEVDGRVVSRDLLDSVAELTFLEEELGLSQLDSPVVLDIGAGYGRLAHRATAAFDVTYVSTDGIAVSTFLCEYYLRFRNAPAEVVALDEVAAAIAGRRVDVAVNVHSFSECPIAAIRWWLDLVAASDVRHLMIVPNADTLVSIEQSGAQIDYLPLILERGFELAVERPKYAHSTTVQEHGIYPARHLLFARR